MKKPILGAALMLAAIPSFADWSVSELFYVQDFNWDATAGTFELTAKKNPAATAEPFYHFKYVCGTAGNSLEQGRILASLVMAASGMGLKIDINGDHHSPGPTAYNFTGVKILR